MSDNIDRQIARELRRIRKGSRPFAPLPPSAYEQRVRASGPTGMPVGKRTAEFVEPFASIRLPASAKPKRRRK